MGKVLTTQLHSTAEPESSELFVKVPYNKAVAKITDDAEELLTFLGQQLLEAAK
jgi:hypothetical protein